MESRGHNENAVRLAALAGDAQIALDRVARGEQDTLEGWIAYGAALNEGRALFPGDLEFGQWVAANSLCQLGTAEVDRHERAAAMWAAANLDQFHEARAAGNARTVRGIHAKWKEIEAEREKARLEAERKAESERQKAEQVVQPDDEPDREASEPSALEKVSATDDAVKRAPAPAPAPNESAGEPDAPGVTPEDVQPAPATAPDDDEIDAEARREFRSLTKDGREDMWVEKCRIIVELHDELSAAKQERDALKATLADMQCDDKDRLIRKLNEELSAAKYRRDQAMGDCKVEEAKRKRAEREKAALQKRVDELQNMEIAL
ncbi:hypothetical protein [Xanthobacter sp. TB0136]|uniref:hypothetical protein n=1 Tax=Xanthobacter sp. TB0136 TaxID=3459177 RepID=UPI00403A27C7